MKQKLILLFLVVFVYGLTSAQSNLPKGFNYVKNIIPSIKVDLRYYGKNNFVAKPVEGYKNEVVILSNKAIIALKSVQEELLQYNLSIKIFDAYRPQQAVNHFVRWAKVYGDTLNKKEFYPNVNKQDLFKEGYIASKSGHTRGSTLDITLVDIASKQELDMGSAWDFFGEVSWVENKTITGQQRANRMLLQTLMRKHGFIHYPKEWWHFTLKNEPFPDTYFTFPVE